MIPKEKDRRHVRIIQLELISTFSALYLVFRTIPTFPMILFPGAVFRAGDIVAPLFGILLGPFIAPLTIIIGTVAGYFVGAPPVFIGLDFLPASVCAIVVGLVVRGKRLAASLLFLALLIVFLVLPFTAVMIGIYGVSIPFNWLHMVGLALLISPLGKYAEQKIAWIRFDFGSRVNLNPVAGSQLFLSLLLISLAGTLAQHLVGGIMTELLVGLNFLPMRFAGWPTFWTFIFFVYPLERAIISLLAGIIAGPVLVALRASQTLNRISNKIISLRKVN